MDSILNKKIVMSLNSAWQAVGWRSVAEAITRINGGVNGDKPPALALDISLNDDGTLSNAVPVSWEEWVNLPVREGDLSLGVKDGAIRCPTVIISPRYSKMPTKAPRLSTGNVLERDGYVCAYTNKKLTRKEATVDHVIPRARGGKNTWDNMVACDKKLNHEKGSKLNEEAGLKLLRKPTAPKAVPVSLFVKEAHHATHRPFLLSKET